MSWQTNIDLIQKLYIAFYGRPADPGGLRFWASWLPENASPDSEAVRNLISHFINSEEAQSRFGNPSLEATIDRIYSYAFRRDPSDAEKAQYAGKSVVDVLVDVISVSYGSDFANLNNKLEYAKLFTKYLDPNEDGIANDDPTGTKFAATFVGNTDAEAIKSKLFDISAANPATQSAVLNDVQSIAESDDSIKTNPPETGQTFTLTTGPDNSVGTSGNDTINGYIDAAGTSDTLTGADVIDGGDGTDTLNITTDGAGAGALPGALITNVEVFKIREVGGTGGTYDFAAVSGEKSVINNKSTDDVTFDNLATGTTVTILGDGTTTNGNTTFKMTSATDAVTINIDGGVTGGNITRINTGNATITINSTGAANTVGTIDLDSGTAIKSVTIDATTNLTASLDANDYAAGASLTVKGAAAKVDLSGAALSDNISKVDASGLTAGGVLVKVNQTDATVDTQFIGGAGNDTLDVGKVVYSDSTKTAAGGDGTDTLKMSDQAALTSTTAKYISGFEVLSLYDDNDDALDTFDASLLSGITSIVLAADSASDGYSITNMSATQAANVKITGNQTVAPTFGVKDATQVGNLDTLAIAIDDGLTATNTITIADINAAGVETIKFSLTDNLTLSAATGLTAFTKIEATGSGALNLTTGGLALNVNSIIDASALTATVTIDASAATTNGLAIKGSSTKNNTITGTAQDDVITGGTGVDKVTYTSGNTNGDTVDFVSDSSADEIDFGANVSLASKKVTITNFDAATATTTEDLVNVSNDNVDDGEVQITAAAGQGALTSDRTYVIEQAVGSAGALTIGGTATITDFTNLTQVAAYLSERFTTAANDKAMFFLNNGTNTYAYYFDEGTFDAGIQAAELNLVGVFNGAVLNAGDIYQTV